MILGPLLFSIALSSADLEVLSVERSTPMVTTDQTFSFDVRVRNQGPHPASAVKVIAGGNALVLLQGITTPPGWTCDSGTPRFDYALSCTTPALDPGEEARFTVTLAAPQPTAMTYRVGARVSSASADPRGDNDRLDSNVELNTSATHAELSMSVRGRSFEVCNDGPDDAKELLAVITGTNEASGKGWTCRPGGPGALCTRKVLRAGATTVIEAGGEGSVEARVRAERIWDSNGKNNGVKVR